MRREYLTETRGAAAGQRQQCRREATGPRQHSGGGRNSTATVRGTKWSMTDTCAGTTTKVTRGSVMVRDLTLKKNRLVKAGHSYFARAPKAKKHP